MQTTINSFQSFFTGKPVQKQTKLPPQKLLEASKDEVLFGTSKGKSVEKLVEEASGSNTKKKRASRGGTRSVSTLNEEQLKRKRANDREAQRAIRERNKAHIESLEKQVAELSLPSRSGASTPDLAKSRSGPVRVVSDGEQKFYIDRTPPNERSYTKPGLTKSYGKGYHHTYS